MSAVDPAESAPPSRRIPLIVASAFFMEMLDATIITTALPRIAETFHSSATALSLGVTAYLVALAVFVPTAGWAAERFGARKLFAAAIIGFSIASIGCGLAGSFWPFVAARICQGAAAAFMSPVGRVVVLRETPKARIIDAIGIITWPGLIAPVIGPPLGGFITTYASWRWIFFLNVPLGLIGAFLVLRFIPKDAPGRPGRFDSLGFVLTAIALACLTYGLTLAGEQRGGDPRLTFGLILVGLAFGVVAVRHALKREAPMLDLRGVRFRSFEIATVSAGLISRIAISASPFLLPLMFQIGFGMSPFQAGLMVFLYMGGNLAMKGATSPILRRFGFKRTLVVNGLICAAALFACAALTPRTPVWIIWPVLFISGLSRSMNFTSVNTLAFADIPPAMRPGASALAATAQQVALTLGVAVGAFALNLSQSLRLGTQLNLNDFHIAFLLVGAMMTISAIWSWLRLPRDAGAEMAGRS